MRSGDGKPPLSLPQVAAGAAEGGRRNRLALVSLFLGIGCYLLPLVTLNLIRDLIGPPLDFFILLLIGPVAAVAAIASGHRARGEIRRTGEAGLLQATIGLILGYLFVLLLSIATVVVVAIVATGSYSFP